MNQATKKRLKKNPRYAYLYSLNLCGSLPNDVELTLTPKFAYLYAKNVLKKSLPQNVENLIILGSFEKNKENDKYVDLYMSEFSLKKNNEMVSIIER